MSLAKLKSKWSSYKYRFVPWLAVNLKDRTSRKVNSNSDELVSDVRITEDLLHLFGCLLQNQKQGLPRTPLQVMEETYGFSVSRTRSKLSDGGTGVSVISGTVREGSLVALYPGTVYRPMEPVLLQSIRNPFFFRCVDHWHIDGNDKGLSKFVYKSCVNRDRIGPYLPADPTWVTNEPANPLNVGQYVNNQSKSFPSNVAYQECTLSLKQIPMDLRRYLPNIHYNGLAETLRIVALISTRNIDQGEELFSSYFTIVQVN